MYNSFVNPWIIAHQAPLSMGFPRQGYWSGMPFSSPGDLSNPGIESMSPACRQMGWTSGEAHVLWNTEIKQIKKNPIISFLQRKQQTQITLFPSARESSMGPRMEQTQQSKIWSSRQVVPIFLHITILGRLWNNTDISALVLFDFNLFWF